jgi:NarL family two-component system response regulator LiaR
MEPMPITILLAEDHKIVREGTRQLLEQAADFIVVGEASNGLEAVRLTRELRPNVVVMDVRMPDLNGIEATQAIKAEYPDVRVLILSAHDDDHYVFPLLDAGANGYLLKTASGAELAKAIRTVHGGTMALDPRIACKVVNRLARKQLYRSDDMVEGLTQRELDVLRGVAEGKGNKEIGEALFISTQTVQVHLRNVFSKLGVSSRVEAVVYAICQGWISLGDNSGDRE